MRVGELLRSNVIDERGRRLGSVDDVRLVQDGPVVGGFGASLRVDGLVVGKGGLGVRLGFHRAQVKGPWPLKAVLGALERRARYVPWARVKSWSDGVVLISGSVEDLPTL
jgi:uncharacterized protein YrrD